MVSDLCLLMWKGVETASSVGYYANHHWNYDHLRLYNLKKKIKNYEPGRWWGSKQQRPILCVHGWQDNANSYNTLIPCLSPKYSYLAIDLPGHGFSSHLPSGFLYSIPEVVYYLRRIQLHFEWPKVSLIGHSLGGACGFLFSSCFTDSVDFFLAIDVIKPLSKNPTDQLLNGRKSIEKLLNYESKNSNAPLYSKSDLIKRWIDGSKNALTEESCKILMQRGAEETNGLFKLRRDYRVKISLNSFYGQKENLIFAEKIKCNVLFIKATDSPYYDKKEDIFEIMDVIKKNAKYFEHHQLPGTHFIHLNNPETVAPVINSFIEKVEGQQ